MWSIKKKLGQKLFLQNWKLKCIIFCSLGRFVPWDIWSLGRFVSWNLFSLGPYVCGRFVLGRFVLGRFCLQAVLSVHHKTDNCKNITAIK